MKLTERIVEALTCPPGRRDQMFFDDDQPGLAVRVTATGRRSWLVQYTLAAQRRRVPLGAGITLAGARTAAKVILGQVAAGQDPAAARKTQAAATRAQVKRDHLTLTLLLKTWDERHLSSRRPRYAKEAVRALERAFGSALGRPAADLDRAAVVRVLDTLPPAMAVRTQAYGRAAFEWARRREMVPVNPFADLPAGHRIVDRDRVLSDPELAAIWHAAAAEQMPSRPLVQLLILTAQRREEVAALPWAELSDDLSTWVLPAARAKNRVQHLVPLSAAAAAVLRGAPRWSDYVFTTTGRGPYAGLGKVKERLDARSGVTDWRFHDLRRTAATGFQRLGVRLEVTEAVLDHVSGSRAGVVGIYQRHDWADEKRDALARWADHVAAIVAANPPRPIEPSATRRSSIPAPAT